jgi:hypothetical protein
MQSEVKASYHSYKLGQSLFAVSSQLLTRTEGLLTEHDAYFS